MTTPAPTPVCTILSADGVGMDQDGIPCSLATWTGELAYGPGLDPTPTTPGVPYPDLSIGQTPRPSPVPGEQSLPVTGYEGTTAALALAACVIGAAFMRLARR